MDWIYWTIAIAGGGVIGALLIWLFYILRKPIKPNSTQAPIRIYGATLPKKAESNPLLIAPPMIGQETAAQWAVRTYRGKLRLGAGVAEDPQYGVFTQITKRMYAAAAGDLGVSRHFNFTDMESLQKHFTALLYLVLDKGVRKNMVVMLEQKHKRLDITKREYDVVINTLYGLLIEYKFPQNVLDTVAKIGEALEPVIVKPDAVA